MSWSHLSSGFSSVITIVRSSRGAILVNAVLSNLLLSTARISFCRRGQHRGLIVRMELIRIGHSGSRIDSFTGYDRLIHMIRPDHLVCLRSDQCKRSFSRDAPPVDRIVQSCSVKQLYNDLDGIRDDQSGSFCLSPAVPLRCTPLWSWRPA